MVAEPPVNPKLFRARRGGRFCISVRLQPGRYDAEKSGLQPLKVLPAAAKADAFLTSSGTAKAVP
jgi:hypothetical protein